MVFILVYSRYTPKLQLNLANSNSVTISKSPLFRTQTHFPRICPCFFSHLLSAISNSVILGLQLTSSPPCWMAINKIILISFIVPVIQHGRQGLCHLNLSGMVANQQFRIPRYFELTVFPLA